MALKFDESIRHYRKEYIMEETIVSLIGSLGFPIVCCIFMWKYINTTMKDFTKTIEENTKMLNKLCDRLDVYKYERSKDE